MLHYPSKIRLKLFKAAKTGNRTRDHFARPAAAAAAATQPSHKSFFHVLAANFTSEDGERTFVRIE